MKFNLQKKISWIKDFYQFFRYMNDYILNRNKPSDRDLGTSPNLMDIFINVNNKSFTILGSSWAYFLFKVEFDGTPVWVRSTHARYKGNIPNMAYWFSLLPSNKGYKVIGEYEAIDTGILPGGEIQKAVVLNFDSFGCLEKGCEQKGCTNPLAYNYDPKATMDNSTCILSNCPPEYQELVFKLTDKVDFDGWKVPRFSLESYHMKIYGVTDSLL